MQAKADKKGEEAKEEEDDVGSVTSEEFNTFLDAMGGRAKERTMASAIIGSMFLWKIFCPPISFSWLGEFFHKVCYHFYDFAADLSFFEFGEIAGFKPRLT